MSEGSWEKNISIVTFYIMTPWSLMKPVQQFVFSIPCFLVTSGSECSHLQLSTYLKPEGFADALIVVFSNPDITHQLLYSKFIVYKLECLNNVVLKTSVCFIPSGLMKHK